MRLLLSGLAAGLAMGFSLIAEGLLRAHLPDAPWRELVSKLGYAVGFLIVVLGRQQLFTENTITPILPLLYNRDARTLGLVARLWALVLAANIAGTWAVSAVLAGTDLFPPEIRQAFLVDQPARHRDAVRRHGAEGDFRGLADRADGVADARLRRGALRRSSCCSPGWSRSPASPTSSRARSTSSFLVLSGQASAADYLWRFFVPTLLGNVLGGVTLVAALNYGQVATEVEA